MFKLERDDIKREVKIFRNDELERVVDVSRHVYGLDLCNLLMQAYEWGQEDGKPSELAKHMREKVGEKVVPIEEENVY